MQNLFDLASRPYNRTETLEPARATIYQCYGPNRSLSPITDVANRRHGEFAVQNKIMRLVTVD